MNLSLETFVNSSDRLLTLESDRETEVSAFGIFIALILFLFLEIFGNSSLICLIIFEKYGMDPQKRTLTNQLFSSCCTSLIILNILIAPLVFLESMCGIGKKCMYL